MKSSILNNYNYKDKIGIIAGDGDFPEILARQAENKKIEVFVAGIKGFAEDNFVSGYKGKIFKIAHVGGIIKYFKDNNVEKIIFAGRVKRPDLKSIIPDGKGLKLLSRINKNRKKGDTDLFNEIIHFLDEEGLKLLSPESFLEENIVQNKLYGKIKPSKSQKQDIEFGIKAARVIGEIDVGQSVVVHDGNIIAVEAIDGTNSLICNAGRILKERNLKNAILVKVIKPKQDKRIDMPTIGLNTIQMLSENNFAGVAIEAGNSLFFDVEPSVALANKNNIFIIGI